MQEFIYILFLFWMGGIIYQIIEMLWSGHSHWTMFILGGLCVVIINMMYTGFLNRFGIVLSCIAGGLIITSLEYIVGYIVNIKLKWNVWDYSDIRFNVKGQICPVFSIFWILLSVPIIFLGTALRFVLM